MATAYPLYSPASAPGLARFLDADICKVGYLQAVSDVYAGSKLGVGTTTPATLGHFASGATAGTILTLEQAYGDADAPDLTIKKARGTIAAPTVITTADDLGMISFAGYSGAGGYVTGAAIKGTSEGTIATTRVPGRLTFWTGTDAAPTVLTERMRIDSTGKVGIGTSSPGSLLHVYSSTATAQARVQSTSTNSGLIIDCANSASTYSYIDFNVATTKKANLGWGVTENYLFFNNTDSVNVAINSAATPGNTYINPSGGKVGVRCTDPNDPLEVRSTARPIRGSRLSTGVTNALYGGMTLEHRSTDQTTFADGFGIGLWLGTRNSSGTYTDLGAYSVVRDGADNQGSLTFTTYTGGTGYERMRVTYDGKVGIGTGSPGSLLTLENNAANCTMALRSTFDTGDTTTAQISFVQSSTNYWVVSKKNAAHSTESNNFTISYYNGSWIQPFVIKTDGKVGIGTTSPSDYLLHVHRDANPPVLFERHDAADTNQNRGCLHLKHTTDADMVDGYGSSLAFYIRDNAAVDNIIGSIGVSRAGADNSGDMVFYTTAAGSNTEKVKITSDGKVGIGTTTPNAKFVVKDTTAVNSEFHVSSSVVATFGGLNLDAYANNLGTLFQTGRIRFSLEDGTAGHQESTLGFQTMVDGTLAERMRISAGGKICMNTDTPSGSAFLTVNGTIVGTQATTTTEAVMAARSLTAGAGLTGGGDLTTDRSFAVGAGTGITVNADDVAVNLAANLTWTGAHIFPGLEFSAGADRVLKISDNDDSRSLTIKTGDAVSADTGTGTIIFDVGAATGVGVAGNLTVGATNAVELSLGRSAGKVGVFGATPVARVSAYTQTYSTASRTHAALTSATLTDSTAGTAGSTIAKAETAMGELNLHANATATVITTTDTYTIVRPAAGTMSQTIQFASSPGSNCRLKYTGTKTRMFHCGCTISVQGAASGDVVEFVLVKNGTVNGSDEYSTGTILSAGTVRFKLGNAGDQASTAIHVMVTLTENDYLELFVKNVTDTDDLTITNLNLFAMAVPDVEMNDDLASLTSQVNKLIDDLTNAKQVINSLVDDGQAYGWLQ